MPGCQAHLILKCTTVQCSQVVPQAICWYPSFVMLVLMVWVLQGVHAAFLQQQMEWWACGCPLAATTSVMGWFLPPLPGIRLARYASLHG